MASLNEYTHSVRIVRNIVQTIQYYKERTAEINQQVAQAIVHVAFV